MQVIRKVLTPTLASYLIYARALLPHPYNMLPAPSRFSNALKSLHFHSFIYFIS